MLRNRTTLILALVVLAMGFAWGVVHLFHLRFTTGDVYPEYSSLRADPLGTKVFFESLQHVEQGRARRNFRAPEHLPEGRDTTLFVFGLPWTELHADEAEYRKLDAFVRNGGRLVVTLYPVAGKPRFWARSGGTNAPAFKTSDPRERPSIDLTEKWGCPLEFVDLARGTNRHLQPVTVKALLPDRVPETLSWHSALVFTNLAFAWRVVYARDTDPVMIERSLGAGTILLATDSYFVSNEAMQREREPRLLAWLAGTSTDVIFDEAHLGVQDTTGIAGLARRYRLHGGVVALLVLAGLFVWKNSLSFVPRSDEDARPDEVHGRHSAAGFVNLLRRSIPADQLLQTCLNEWHKSRLLDRRASPRKLERVRAAVDNYNTAAAPDAVESYKTISAILNEK